jgi:prolipoprotein diacylglyceryltransferase
VTPTSALKDGKSTAFTASSIIALLAGIWLFVSPWVYGSYQSENSLNNWVLGAVIAILAAFRLGYPITTQWISWINTLLGIWTFLSPWIYGYNVTHGRFINSLCVGVIVFVVSLRNAMSTRDIGHPLTTRT